MTEEVNKKELDEAQELDLLKKRADQLGIKYSNNISLATLRERVNSHLSDDVEEEEDAQVKADKNTKRQNAIKEATKLVRIRLTVNNTRKTSLYGELFSAGNDVVGSIRKFIPYGAEFYENGYHVPNIILKQLQEKKFLHVYTKRDPVTRENITTQKWMNEFTISILPDLTPKELEELKQRQMATKAID